MPFADLTPKLVIRVHIDSPIMPVPLVPVSIKRKDMQVSQAMLVNVSLFHSCPGSMPTPVVHIVNGPYYSLGG